MELKEAIELLKEMKNNCLIKRDYIDEKAEKKAKAIDTVLKVLDMPEEEVVFYGTRSAGKTLKSKRTYEWGLIVGTKRERVYWENKIKEKIEELKEQDLEIYEGWDSLDVKIAKYEDGAVLDTLQELLKGE